MRPDALIPVFDPLLESAQFALDARGAEILPQPAGREAEEAVDPVPHGEGVECVDEGLVDVLDDAAEFYFGDQRVEDLGVEVRVCGCEVAFDHPVALDADDPRILVFWAGAWDVDVRVRETWVCGTPC